MTGHQRVVITDFPVTYQLIGQQQWRKAIVQIQLIIEQQYYRKGYGQILAIVDYNEKLARLYKFDGYQIYTRQRVFASLATNYVDNHHISQIKAICGNQDSFNAIIAKHETAWIMLK